MMSSAGTPLPRTHQRQNHLVEDSAGQIVEVDGETFAVRRSASSPGFDFDWLSGPNPDYGFSSGLGRQPARGEIDLGGPWFVDSIRQFLSMVDPATGYIG